MTPEAQRIAIAQVAGGYFYKVRPNKFNPRGIRRKSARQYLPDYLDDLNACFEMEKVLTFEQWSVYVDYLIELPMPDDANYRGYQTIHATAAQRAEAFLRTLGLWQDSDLTTTRARPKREEEK